MTDDKDAEALVFDLRDAGYRPIASVEHETVKQRRRQDRVDALKLLEVATTDLADVRQNLTLITERGFHRDQDLAAKLQSLLDELAADDE